MPSWKIGFDIGGTKCATILGKVDKDSCCCVGCAECVIACPTGAWTRSEQNFYRVTLGGRTGKKDPRAGKLFLNWITEEPLLQMFGNWTKFSAWVMDNKPQYLHGGHLIDMAGYHKFKELILEGISFSFKQIPLALIFISL